MEVRDRMKVYVTYYYDENYDGGYNERVVTGVTKTKPKHNDYEEYELQE